jgi:hypothetical protein
VARPGVPALEAERRLGAVAATALADLVIGAAPAVHTLPTTSAESRVRKRPTPGAAPDMFIWIEPPAGPRHHSNE